MRKKAGMFDELLVSRLIRDPHIVTTMNAAKARAWNAFSYVVGNFLGNRKASTCQQIVEEFLLSLQALGCRMSIKFTICIVTWSNFQRTWVM